MTKMIILVPIYLSSFKQWVREMKINKHAHKRGQQSGLGARISDIQTAIIDS